MALPYRLMRMVLFRLPPDEALATTLRVAEAAGRRRWIRNLVGWWYGRDEPTLRTQVMGHDFPSPLGLAPGFDRDGRALALLSTLGFGHLEVGGILAEPSRGVTGPRLGRLDRQRGTWYVPGQPSAGFAVAARNLGRCYPGIPVGVNLTARAPLPGDSPDRLLEEVALAARGLAPLATHVTLDTQVAGWGPGEGLEDPARLAALVGAVTEAVASPSTPVLVKLPTDLGDGPLLELAAAALSGGADGWVAGAGRRDVRGLPLDWQDVGGRLPPGRLHCGPGLLAGTLEATRRLRATFGLGPTLIACGGVTRGRDAFELLCAGADLVQLLSAMVYQGPGVAGRMARELAREVARSGARSLRALRGTAP